MKEQKKQFIGFAGPAGIGKSTNAEWFEKEHNFFVLSFAKPVKEALVALTGLSINHFTDIELKEKQIPGLKEGVTPRILMQKMATDFIREMIDPDFFVWRMKQMVSNNSDEEIVIDDIRFENEAEFIRKNGGKIFHLVGEIDPVTKEITHKSEFGIKVQSEDYVVERQSSVELNALEISKLLED